MTAMILLVDDDEDIRDALSSLLSDEGYRVECVANGREALAFLSESQSPPRLILLDWMMPVMDGQSFLAVQEQTPSIASIPVVVISAAGKGRLSDIRDRLVLPKPLDLRQLLAVVRNACAASL